MATNDFLPFAGGAGANALDQADYEALAALSAGFTSGVAPSAACNKVWRQSTIMAAVLAQLIVDNTGQNAVDDGTTATLLANLKAATTGRLINVQTFTASGTYTPTAGTKSVVVEVVGGGGAGGGTTASSASQASVAGGGGGGAYSKSRLASGFSGAAVTVGQGGTGVTGGNGGNGGASSFGALLSASGGIGSPLAITYSTFPQFAGYGAGGSVGVGGNIVNAGGSYGTSGFMGNLTGVVSGSGGGTTLGGGANAVVSATANGNAGATPGAGGSGGSTLASGAAKSGGNGAAGIVIVYEYA